MLPSIKAAPIEVSMSKCMSTVLTVIGFMIGSVVGLWIAFYVLPPPSYFFGH
jgi:hypothetical protein